MARATSKARARDAACLLHLIVGPLVLVKRSHGRLEPLALVAVLMSALEYSCAAAGRLPILPQRASPDSAAGVARHLAFRMQVA